MLNSSLAYGNGGIFGPQDASGSAPFMWQGQMYYIPMVHEGQAMTPERAQTLIQQGTFRPQQAPGGNGVSNALTGAPTLNPTAVSGTDPWYGGPPLQQGGSDTWYGGPPLTGTAPLGSVPLGLTRPTGAGMAVASGSATPSPAPLNASSDPFDPTATPPVKPFYPLDSPSERQLPSIGGLTRRVENFNLPPDWDTMSEDERVKYRQTMPGSAGQNLGQPNWGRYGPGASNSVNPVTGKPQMYFAPSWQNEMK